jgi:predicted metal-dependent hydrolase
MSIDYTLVRSRRKTCAIYIRGGKVEVRAPLRMPVKDIERFVAAKSGWISRKRAEYPAIAAEPAPAVDVEALKRRAQAELPPRVAHYAALMGVAPSAVRISDAKSRWGSCSAKGSINLSWRLMLAEAPERDYVVVHELAHLREMNHSPRFWAVVAEVMPDYPARRVRLRTLARRRSMEE